MRRGFTLAELLIALVILGVIATFTIPKVLQTQQSSENRTKLKEAASAVADIVKNGVAQGAVNSGNFSSYVLARLNAVKICTNSRTDGCWSAAQGDYAGEELEPGIIMHTGATIAGINNGGGGTNALIFDANGALAPNAMGQDQIWLAYCYGPSNCTGTYWNSGSRPNAPGTMGPVGNQQSSDLYDVMFAQ